ncbi:MAG TPA: cupin domain-containing protein [Vicinamibacteria bacterium]|nr:cupin domain-containing protein [Vicinamibacteria bacterium]
MDIRTVLDARRFSPEKMQKVNLFATTDLFLDVYCFETGQNQKVHVHEKSTKYYIVLEGHARFEISGETKNLGPGQAVLARAGEPHGVENQTDDRLVLLVGMAPPPEHA